MRKTVAVNEVLARANSMMATPDSTLSLDSLTPEQAFRLGIAAVLENILHSTGTYGGFRYANVDHTVDPPAIPDETRRVYTARLS